MIDVNQLERTSTSVKYSHEVRRIAGALASAMNDWPTQNLLSLDRFVSELRNEYGLLSFSNLNEAAKNMRRTLAEPWKAESLAGLLDAWDAKTAHMTLDELIDELKRLTAECQT